MPGYAACPGCGAQIRGVELASHICDPGTWLEHQVRLRREEIARIDDELAAFLGTTRGRFELWYAERTRRRGVEAAENPGPSASAPATPGATRRHG